MVWFQCEDCGENLKKPKLPTHFRMCSATKLSCIDCGLMFGRDSIQGHTQCITEAEKYGPKGQSKPLNGTPAKPKDNSKPDFDINVGLSNRYPWFCSICYTKATSQQTLLAHADGKKHRAKAKAIHAKQQGSEPSTVDKKDVSDNASNGDTEVTEQKKVDLPISSGVANGDSHTEKKRKLETLNTVHAEEAKGGELKKAKKQDREKKINWKKLISSALKSNEDKTLKMKKLKKVVLESLVDSGVTRDKSELKTELELKVSSSSRFTVDGKYVKLVAKD